jgi:hypothetical protein
VLDVLPVFSARISQDDWHYLIYGGNYGIPVSYCELPALPNDNKPQFDYDSTSSELFLFDNRDCMNAGSPLIRIRLSWSPTRNRTYVAHKFNHVLMDGASFYMYMGIFTSCVRGLPYRKPHLVSDRSAFLLDHCKSVTPNLQLKATNYVPYSHLQLIRIVMQLPKVYLMTGSSISLFTFTYDILNRLKQHVLFEWQRECDELNEGREVAFSLSTSDILTAFTWKVISALQSEFLGIDIAKNEELFQMVFQLDFRRTTQPPISPNYFGNCILNCMIEEKGANIANLTLYQIAKKIRNALNWNIQNAPAIYGSMELRMQKEENFAWSFDTVRLFHNRTAIVSNVTKFQVGEIDFGNGTVLQTRAGFTWRLPWITWVLPAFENKNDLLGFFTLPYQMKESFERTVNSLLSKESHVLQSKRIQKAAL